MLSAKEKYKVLNYITKQFVDILKSRYSESESCGAQNVPKNKDGFTKIQTRNCHLFKHLRKKFTVNIG